MFIDHIARGYMKFVNRFVGAVLILGFVAVFLRRDPTGPEKYMLGFMTAGYLLVVGFICLLRPWIIQEHLVQHYTQHPRLARVSPFAAFVRSERYVLFLRLCGGLAWAVVCLLVYAFRTRL